MTACSGSSRDRALARSDCAEFSSSFADWMADAWASHTPAPTTSRASTANTNRRTRARERCRSTVSGGSRLTECFGRLDQVRRSFERPGSLARVRHRHQATSARPRPAATASEETTARRPHRCVLSEPEPGHRIRVGHRDVEDVGEPLGQARQLRSAAAQDRSAEALDLGGVAQEVVQRGADGREHVVGDPVDDDASAPAPAALGGVLRTSARRRAEAALESLRLGQAHVESLGQSAGDLEAAFARQHPDEPGHPVHLDDDGGDLGADVDAGLGDAGRGGATAAPQSQECETRQVDPDGP